MTPLEQDIRETARNLQGLYRELHAHKWTKQVREVRTMKVAPGPQAPTPGWITSLDDELTRALQPLVAECAGHIDRTVSIWPHGATMCEWIALKANYIVDLGVADALLEEMQDQVAVIKKRLSNLPGAPMARESKERVRSRIETVMEKTTMRYTAADAASFATAVTGLPIDRKQVTYWGRSREEVTVELDEQGVGTYLVSEVISAAKAYQDKRSNRG